MVGNYLDYTHKYLVNVEKPTAHANQTKRQQHQRSPFGDQTLCSALSLHGSSESQLLFYHQPINSQVRDYLYHINKDEDSSAINYNIVIQVDTTCRPL